MSKIIILLLEMWRITDSNRLLNPLIISAIKIPFSNTALNNKTIEFSTIEATFVAFTATPLLVSGCKGRAFYLFCNSFDIFFATLFLHSTIF